MKKIVLSILLILLMIVTALTLTGCEVLDQLFPVNPPQGGDIGGSGDKENTETPEEPEGQTFVFTELEDGTYSISSTDYDSLPADLVIPSEYEGKPVTVIAEYGFTGAKITSLTIPDSVHTIGWCAFSHCKNLVKVDLGDGVTSTGEHSFSYCEKLEKIIYGNNLKVIGEFAFEECHSITEVIIPEGVVTVDGYAFYNCTSIKNIKISSSVETIGYLAFAFTSNSLESIEVADGNANYYVDSGCLIDRNWMMIILGHKNSVIPDDVRIIGSHAFFGCEGLTEIVIPASVTQIFETTFTNCKNLESITVNEGNIWYRSENNCLIYIENKLVLGCKNSVIPAGIVSIENNAFFGCQDLSSIVIPESVTSIGDAAFYNCDGLTSIVIPDSVTYIGDDAFRACDNLENVVIGKGVQTIGNTVFYESPKVTDIYYTGTEQEWKKIVIKNDMIDNNVLLNATKHYNYVPEE